MQACGEPHLASKSSHRSKPRSIVFGCSARKRRRSASLLEAVVIMFADVGSLACEITFGEIAKVDVARTPLMSFSHAPRLAPPSAAEDELVCDECEEEKPRTELSAADKTAAEDAQLVAAYTTILRCLGESHRSELHKTPLRAAKALRTLTSGYQTTLEEAAGTAVFSVDQVESTARPLGLVVVRDIRIHSLCEHHLLPFYGRAHIAYLPGGDKVLGLSKLARIADMYSRRLQMQERLTQQIGDALERAAAPRGVAVVLQCSHMCMCSRGVRKDASSTSTSDWRGEFEHNPHLREEFWRLVNEGDGGMTAGSEMRARL